MRTIKSFKYPIIMKNLVKLKDVGVTPNKLYVFITQEQAEHFCDEFERPQDLVGVDVR